MNQDIIRAITKSKSRKFLYHFTRVENLESIVHFDTLYSSSAIHPNPLGKRRCAREENWFNGHRFILNEHLRIADSMMHPDMDIQTFRAFLDQNVFLWPTFRACQKMMKTYARREPDNKFAVLRFDASQLLMSHYNSVRLSKYDSGSMPRYPKRCSYRKSLRMFLPLNQFATSKVSLVPRIPSEIYEILVDEKITHVQRYLEAIYCVDPIDIPESWRTFYRSWNELA